MRCAACTPGGVLVANLLGSFTLGLLTVVWNAYAAVTVRIGFTSFRLLFGAGMMGGYTTYSSIAGGSSADDFSAVRCIAGIWCWRCWCCWWVVWLPPPAAC